MSYRTSSKNDNYTTPKNIWELIKDFIPENSIIWESAYCNGSSGRVFEELGFNVIHKDRDYFNWEPEEYTIQITNPPFSIKKDWIKRAMELGKPWIMIMPEGTLSTNYFKEYVGNKIQLVIPRRINFDKVVGNTVVGTSSASFRCFFYCYGLNLPNDLNFI